MEGWSRIAPINLAQLSHELWDMRSFIHSAASPYSLACEEGGGGECKGANKPSIQARGGGGGEGG